VLVGEQNGGFLVAQILNEQLAEGSAGQRDFLIKKAGRAVLAGGDIQFDGAQAERGSSMISFNNRGDLRRRVIKEISILSNRARLA